MKIRAFLDYGLNYYKNMLENYSKKKDLDLP